MRDWIDPNSPGHRVPRTGGPVKVVSKFYCDKIAGHVEGTLGEPCPVCGDQNAHRPEDRVIVSYQDVVQLLQDYRETRGVRANSRADDEKRIAHIDTVISAVKRGDVSLPK